VTDHKHVWIDVTAVGSSWYTELCTICQARRQSPVDVPIDVHLSDGTVLQPKTVIRCVERRRANGELASLVVYYADDRRLLTTEIERLELRIS
jgi:hypothetical protein